MKEFKIAYQRAYESILPDPGCLASIMDRTEKKRMRQAFYSMGRAAAAACMVVTIMSFLALPVMAKNVSAVYRVIEKYAPALSDYILPVRMSDTKNGITMQVEAVDVKENTAEVLVSFCDAVGSGQDLIRGKVDLYDSYHLQSYGGTSGIGGCSFLEYDASEDKAYFKISLATDGTYDREKIRFAVGQLLCNVSREKLPIALDGMVKNPKLKWVSINGESRMEDNERFEQYQRTAADDSLLCMWEVMDLVKADESMAETLAVTGAGYADGILRVQICRGNFETADRHMEIFLTDRKGKEARCDASLMWQEEAGESGERLLFEEHWFLVDESQLDQLQMYGIFHVTDGNIEGGWEVTFRLDP